MDVTSLALSLLTACVQGYRSFQSLRSLGRDARVILSKIEIQENRLAIFKEDIQRKLAIFRSSPLKRPIVNTLESIHLLTTDASHLKKHYNLDISAETQSDQESGVPSSAVSVRIKRSYVWIWLAFDKDSLENLAGELKVLTDGLGDLLQVMFRNSFTQGLPGAWITALNTSDLDALKILVEASSTTYAELASAAEHKLERLSAEIGRDSQQPSTSFDQSAFSPPLTQEELRATAMHLEKRQVVLLEWRVLPTDYQQADRALKRLERVANLLSVSKPANIQTLDCLGYVRDTVLEHASLVYRVPPGSSRDPPLPLLSMLESSAPNEMPSLDDRYTLALKVTETLFHLHMSGWLHKYISSHNILFFRRDAWSSSTGPVTRSGILREPYLTGFEFSREGDFPSTTETVVEAAGLERYRHPSCHGPLRDRFRKIYDLFSLGIVLIEIGCWKAFSKYPEYKSNVSVAENRDRILRHYLNGTVAYYVGEDFEDVIRICLTGNFGLDESRDADFQQQVYEKVLRPLQKLATKVR